MNILAIDTSGPVCGAAVLTDRGILYEKTVQNALTHSVNLMPMVEDALTASSLTLEQLDRIAVTVGPGSFTGVRIGVSTVKGIAHGCGKPCVPVDALEAMALSAGRFDGIICPLQDARAGQVYTARFRSTGSLPERLSPDTPIPVSELAEQLLATGEKVLFLGDGMPVHREKLRTLMGGKAVFAAPHAAFLRPASVAVLAASSENELDYLSLMPLYLRAPSAERNRKLVEAANG